MNILGLTKEEERKPLSDVILMRLAQRLRTDHLYALTTRLLKYVKYLDDIKVNFPDLEQSDHAYLVMVEWIKQTRNKRGDTSAGQMVKILKNANIDHHLVCLVCKTPLSLLMVYVKRLERACLYLIKW